MKKYFFIIVLMLLSYVGFSQIWTEVPPGKYYVSTTDNNKDTVQKSDRARSLWTYTGTGSLVADTVFYVPSTAPNDTIATLMTAANNQGDAAILIERGSTRRTAITVSQDSLKFSSYGTGDKPILNGADVTDFAPYFAANLITNHDMETNANWTASGTSITREQSSTRSFEGTSSWYCNTANTGAGILSPAFNVVAGTKYYCSAWVYVVSGRIEFRRENGYLAGLTGIQTTVGDVGKWVHLQDTVTATTSGSEYVKIISYLAAAEFYIDYVEVNTNTGQSGKVWYANAPVIPNFNGIPANYVCIVNDDGYTAEDSKDSLDAVGEYFVDKTPSPDVIYVYCSENLNDSTVEVSSKWAGVLVEQKSNITIKNLEIRYAGHSGIYCYGDGASQTYGNTTITNCEAYHNRVNGIMFSNGYVNSTVSYCEASHNGNNFYSAFAEGSPNSGSDNNTFSHCASSYSKAHTVGTGLFTDGHGFGIYASDSCIVEYCTSDYDDSGIISATDGNDLYYVARYNKINGATLSALNAGNNSGTKKHEVYYNLITNSKSQSGYAVNLYNSTVSGGVNFFNNTIYQSTGDENAIMTIGNGAGINLKNNVLYHAQSGVGAIYWNSSALPQSSDNNWYYSPSTFSYIRIGSTPYYMNHLTLGTIEDWRTFSSLDLNSDVTDPLFTNAATGDFTLQSGSPAINAGVDVGLTTDILGNPIVGLPDIGAYEKQE